MKKRLIALLLAFVMVLGLTATVFAEGGISIASIQPEAPTHTYIFQAGGVEIGSQIIKNNESLKDPGVRLPWRGSGLSAGIRRSPSIRRSP